MGASICPFGTGDRSQKSKAIPYPSLLTRLYTKFRNSLVAAGSPDGKPVVNHMRIVMNNNKINNNTTYFINNNMKMNNNRNNNNDTNNSGEYENHNIVLLELTRQNSSRALVPRMGNSRHQYNNSHERKFQSLPSTLRNNRKMPR